jgi:uncharacterized membrane protein
MQAFTLDSIPPAAVEKPAARSAQAVRAEVWIVAAALIALVLKLVIAWNTFGTNDVISFYKFAHSLNHHGLEQTYTSSIAFNHPPLVAHYLELIYKLSRLSSFERNGITFPFLLRLPAILADFISVLVLLRLGKEISPTRIPSWALLLFALSPVSVMVSGFHGNTDPIMVMFLLIAAYACIRENPIFCGLFFALSCQIKIVPLLLLPIFFFYWNYRRVSLRFLISLGAVSLVLWSEPLLNFPVIFIKNVLSYGSFWGLWGITYFLRLTGWSQFGRITYFNFTLAQILVGVLLKLLIVFCVFGIAWRRRALSPRALLASLAYGWMVFFIFSPGVCAQYMVWLAPFVLLLSPVLYGFLELGSSLFLFFFYNAIADKFPWYVGISTNGTTGAWTPWSVWPWAILIAGLIVLWRSGQRTNPSLRLWDWTTVPPLRAD